MGTPRHTGLADVHHGRERRWSPLLAPMRYLRIEAPGKRRYDFVLPGIISVVLIVGYLLLDPAPTIFGSSGILSGISSLLVMAVPFLIGALATIAMASPLQSLDSRPVGAPILLDGITLSVRQFVCYLLGYLSFLGFVLLIGITLANAIQPAVSKALLGFPKLERVVELASVSILFTAIGSFVLTTFWALYFLTDVVNRR